MTSPYVDETPLAGIPLRLRLGSGRSAVSLSLLSQGRDLILRVGGGSAHVGAVAVHRDVAGPCRALTVVPGHREGPLAEAAAARLAAATGRTVVAVVGIHQDAATRQEIAQIVANVERGVSRLLARLAAASRNPEESR